MQLLGREYYIDVILGGILRSGFMKRLY